MDLGNGVNKEQRLQRTKSEAEEAVRVLLEYLGEDPSRDGLSETVSWWRPQHDNTNLRRDTDMMY